MVIVSGEPAPAKPSPKKSTPKRKRDEAHFSPDSSEKAPASLDELRISIQRLSAEEETAHPPVVYESSTPEKQAVVYCICNGVLKRCLEKACCVKQEFRVFAAEMEL